jgi:hypothetical protein
MAARRSRPAEAPGGGSRWLIPTVVIVLAVCAAMLAFSSREEAPDPNYVRARDSVAAYELGRELADRNYNEPVYREALEALARVSPDSVSAEPAAHLARAIRQRTDEFHARLRADEERRLRDARLRRERDEAQARRQLRDRARRWEETPECSEGEEDEHTRRRQQGER